jgi:hypothetical protein
MAEAVIDATLDTQGNSGQTGKDTIVDDKTSSGEKTVVSDWSDDWRAKMAGGDEKEAKRLERFASPKEVYKSYRSFESRLSTGELKSSLPKDAKPEAIAAWRKENGIPDDAKGYELPDGMKADDPIDKPMIEKVLADLHASNASKEVAKTALKSFVEFRKALQEQTAENDSNAKRATQDELRVEWGGDYRANANAMENMLAGAPPEVGEWLANARGADGKMLAGNPAVIRWLVQTARELNPTATIVPAGGDQAATIETELQGLREKMKDSRAWNSDPKLQARYVQLITARDRIKK